jgi:hypothetical protein
MEFNSAFKGLINVLYVTKQEFSASSWRSNQRLSTLFINLKPIYRYHTADNKSKQNGQFKVCKSVHHRTIQINDQPNAAIFRFIILTFIYSSTCFGRFPAHYQELNDYIGSLWFYLRIAVTVVLSA